MFKYLTVIYLKQNINKMNFAVNITFTINVLLKIK